ncbi:uncharacterized protein PG998_004400 [Apiospora kogelbergensis]|uniref:uncharacterized protein n=1 Tax=Apiospora kogelbergensis TaxID=1337665 RepID=UPI00312E264B
MSRALASAAALKADIRLAQAVSEFEADLQGDAKREFSLSKSLTVSSPPTVKSVLQLTAKIDHTAHAVGSRCYGPRLTKTLECIQQFAAIGDVIIGGSQNIVACGVWTIVRTTLLAAIKFQSYFESLSELFLGVGKSAPRYNEMVALQPKSRALHDFMSEYFIVVVNLCHHVYNLSVKSKLGQLRTAIGKPDMGSYQRDLEKWSARIRDQFGLDEARDNSASRKILQKLSSAHKYGQKLALRQNVMDGCTRFDHQVGWKLARNTGSTRWFSTVPAYLDWKEGQSHSALLRVAGTLGSGKTVLLANMVEDILLAPTTRAVAFFFCRPDDDDSLRSSTIFGSLARQMIEAIPLDKLQGSAMDTVVASSGRQDMTKFLQSLLPLFPRVYFILDGLDECPPNERRMVFTAISDLLNAPHGGAFFMCVSNRLGAEQRVEEEFESLQSEILLMPEENQEIHEFIQTKLETSLETGALTIGDPTLILQIRDVLQKGARGMFLWAALQIDSICSKKTDESIRAALDDLPTDLPEIYRRILHQRKPLAPEYQDRVLKLLLVAMRPLSLDELREAISVLPLQTAWDPKKLVNNIRTVLSCCGSLIVVDEEQLTAHFIHPSVQQFLLSGKEDPNNFRFSRQAAELDMARVILTYLHYNVFQKQISTIRVPSVPAQDAPARITAAALGNSSVVRTLALQLLRKRDPGRMDIGKTLSDISGQYQSQTQQRFHFYLYAHEYWLHHTKVLSQDDEPEIHLLKRIFLGIPPGWQLHFASRGSFLMLEELGER